MTMPIDSNYGTSLVLRELGVRNEELGMMDAAHSSLYALRAELSDK